ncbi:MAG: hypothetical protein K5765_08590 [Clostridia bacterium]|nr:hypothetical protein [Clostridia bacterium]
MNFSNKKTISNLLIILSIILVLSVILVFASNVVKTQSKAFLEYDYTVETNAFKLFKKGDIQTSKISIDKDTFDNELDSIHYTKIRLDDVNKNPIKITTEGFTGIQNENILEENIEITKASFVLKEITQDNKTTSRYEYILESDSNVIICLTTTFIDKDNHEKTKDMYDIIYFNHIDSVNPYFVYSGEHEDFSKGQKLIKYTIHDFSDSENQSFISGLQKIVIYKTDGQNNTTEYSTINLEDATSIFLSFEYDQCKYSASLFDKAGNTTTIDNCVNFLEDVENVFLEKTAKSLLAITNQLSTTLDELITYSYNDYFEAYYGEDKESYSESQKETLVIKLRDACKKVISAQKQNNQGNYNYEVNISNGIEKDIQVSVSFADSTLKNTKIGDNFTFAINVSKDKYDTNKYSKYLNEQNKGAKFKNVYIISINLKSESDGSYSKLLEEPITITLKVKNSNKQFYITQIFKISDTFQTIEMSNIESSSINENGYKFLCSTDVNYAQGEIYLFVEDDNKLLYFLLLIAIIPLAIGIAFFILSFKKYRAFKKYTHNLNEENKDEQKQEENTETAQEKPANNKYGNKVQYKPRPPKNKSKKKIKRNKSQLSDYSIHNNNTKE